MSAKSVRALHLRSHDVFFLVGVKLRSSKSLHYFYFSSANEILKNKV